MEKILYDLMDWAGIEELVYSEASDPGRLLGEHVIKEGLLIQAFLPNAEKMSVKIGGELFPMEMADENGFFAVLLEDRKELVPYHFCITYTDGDNEEIVDPYSYQFHTAFTEEEVRKFGAGIYYDSYEKFGAHPAVEAGITGVHFAVWAPDAMRVSVVGDFNFWDGRRHQMKKRGPSGIYEIFIPGLKPGAIYKYEIKTKAGLPMLKADPYGNFAELRPNTASVVWDMSGYKWNDDEWIKEREAAKDRLKDSPMSIYEVHLGSWMQKPVAQDENGEDINGSQFYNYRETAEKLAAYVKETFSKPVRINTNGMGNLIWNRDITPEFEGLIDTVSISLNTPNAERYHELVRSKFGDQSFDAMISFAKKCTQHVPKVVMTTVATTITKEEEAQCSKICEEVGAVYRIRPWED